MTSKKLVSQGLDDLCTKEQLQLLDVVDSLRSQGLSQYISLPQIIVCGDQSSGKSSVLEAISGVSFPVKSNLCTRFPTELVLRKTPAVGIKVSITPHRSRTQSDKDDLSKFDGTLESFSELPDLVEKAKFAMGISSHGKAFSEDILRIEISGPDRPHLTIVDLPGLIHSENKQQSASDIKLITNVVKKYMKEPRSVMLAVVSAKNDYANQIVLKLAREADPKGSRTLGVITKPDTLIPGSGSEDTYLALAQNQDVEFRLGWHVLKNRDTDVESWALEDRDALEVEFFSRGAWATLPAEDLGIKSLRERLSSLLINQIAKELPHLMREIETKTASCQQELDKLGRARVTAQEQRMYLMQISQSFQGLTQAAVDGTYNDTYFGDTVSSVGYQKHIRAVVQNLNREFATELEENGRRYKIVSKTIKEVKGLLENIPTDDRSLTRDEYVEKITTVVKRTRGRELPGMVNPMIIADLFKEQSSPWPKIAEAHVQKVWKAVREGLKHLIVHVADVTSVKAILDVIVEPSLKSLLKTLQSKLSSLLEPHQSGHPITYNHYFTETLQKLRLERQTAHFTDALRQVFGNLDFNRKYEVNQNVDFGSLVRNLADNTEPDMDRFAASEALDCLNAYYKVYHTFQRKLAHQKHTNFALKVALKRFIDDVAVEVIETCLLGKIRQIMDPVSVAGMSDAEVSNIAAENEESRRARERLQTKLQILQSGTETCKTIVSRHGIGEFAEPPKSAAYTDITDPDDSEAVVDESKELTDIDEDTPNEENEEESPEVLQEPASTTEPEDEKYGDNVHIATAQIEDEPVPEVLPTDDMWDISRPSSKKDKKKKKTQNYLLAEE